MAWDPIWERLFRSQAWGKYPPEDLIRFIARRFYDVPDRAKVRVLELGCGTGANVWFMAREGFDVSGIDGSETAITKAGERIRDENLTASLTVGDIAALEGIYPPSSFDAVVDVGCLTCNRLEDVREAVRQARVVLKPGGAIFSSLIATGTFGEGMGVRVEAGTYRDIPEGPLADRGLIHLFTEAEIHSVFAEFAPLSIDISVRGPSDGSRPYRLYIVQGAKPGS